MTSAVKKEKLRKCTIAGVVFGVIICIGFITFAAVMYIRKKREQDLEYSRKAKVLKVSTESAGVYIDTTLDYRFTKDSRTQGPEYKSLARNKKLYESDSEDEL